ncbi:MAG TPA: hypothetical protein VKU80_01315, partial [Planctomycetota bacterium]|nr:hypothetical protein [Planctomycetota bacterium]
MTIARNETWIQLADLNDQQELRFTPELKEVMGELGGEAKAFVGHLLGLWYDPFEHLLDYYSGNAKHSKDQPGTFNSNGLDEPQDVVEYWAEQWAKNSKEHVTPVNSGTGLGLDVTWYRDVLRSKLVSIRL